MEAVNNLGCGELGAKERTGNGEFTNPNIQVNNLSNSTNHKRSNELVNHVVHNHDTLLPATGIGTQSSGAGASGGGGSGTSSNRNSCLIAPTTPTTRMRISNAKTLSPVDGEVDDENATKEMPDAMKLAADLVSLFHLSLLWFPLFSYERR